VRKGEAGDSGEPLVVAAGQSLTSQLARGQPLELLPADRRTLLAEAGLQPTLAEHVRADVAVPDVTACGRRDAALPGEPEEAALPASSVATIPPSPIGRLAVA